MNVLIIGLGRTGSYLAEALQEAGVHRVVVVESDEKRAGRSFPGVRVLWADGCDPAVLEEAGVRSSDLVVAATGDDEDNLVVAQLAKFHFGVPRVIARVNHPQNQWLYSREWGVDVAVSPTDIITKIIEEEMSLGDLVTLLKLRGGKVALAEIKLNSSSKAAGKLVSEVVLPQGTVFVVILRGDEMVVPGGATRLEPEDEIIALTSVDKEHELEDALR